MTDTMVADLVEGEAEGKLLEGGGTWALIAYVDVLDFDLDVVDYLPEPFLKLPVLLLLLLDLLCV